MKFFTEGSQVTKKSLIFGMGQLLAICNALSQVFNQYLANNGVNIPGFQLIFVYASLALLLIPHYMKNGFSPKSPSVYFGIFILSLIDVEANYIVVKAFSESYFVTIGLLLKCSLPFSAILGFFLFKRKFFLVNLVGSALAIAGAILVFYKSYSSEDSKDMNTIKGNIYVIIGAFLYSLSNVGIEYMMKSVKFNGIYEFMGFLGLFGVLITAIQAPLLEHAEIAAVDWSANFGYFIGFVAVLFILYTVSTLFFSVSEATFFNMSLLTADVFNAFFSYFLFDYTLPWFNFVSFALNVFGIVIYHIKEPKDIYTEEKPKAELA